MTRFAKAIPMDPYPAVLYVAKTRAMYEAAHMDIFGEPAKSTPESGGNYSMGIPVHGTIKVLVWGQAVSSLVHELAHAVLLVFEACGIDPCAGDGEPFAYMIGELCRKVARV